MEDALQRYKKHFKRYPGLEKNLRDYYESITQHAVPYDRDEAYKEYFKTIYKNRDTIQKSSIYPWRKFNQEEVDKLIKHFNAFK